LGGEIEMAATLGGLPMVMVETRQGHRVLGFLFAHTERHCVLINNGPQDLDVGGEVSDREKFLEQEIDAFILPAQDVLRVLEVPRE
jgi:hypothetical protein